MPRDEGEYAGDRAAAAEHQPPRRMAAVEPDHELLGRPAVDIETVGQIAPARGAQRRNTRVKREPQRQITAGERKQHDEPAGDDADGEKGQRRKRDAIIEDARAAQLVENHADREERQHPAPAAEPAEGRRKLHAGHADDEQRNAGPQVQEPRQAERQHHQVHHEFVAQRPQRAVDLEPDRIVDEQHAGQLVHLDRQRRVAGDVAIRLQPREIVRQRQLGHERRQHEGREDQRRDQAGKDAQAALQQIARRRAGLLPALRDKEAADGEENEDAGQAEDRLPPGEPDQRLVILRALRNEERMREDDRDRGEQAQNVEVVVARSRRPAVHAPSDGFIVTANITVGSFSRIAARRLASSEPEATNKARRGLRRTMTAVACPLGCEPMVTKISAGSTRSTARANSRRPASLSRSWVGRSDVVSSVSTGTAESTASTRWCRDRRWKMARPSPVSMRNCSSQLSPRAASSAISANMSSQSASWLQVIKASLPSCSITRSSLLAKPS